VDTLAKKCRRPAASELCHYCGVKVWRPRFVGGLSRHARRVVQVDFSTRRNWGEAPRGREISSCFFSGVHFVRGCPLRTRFFPAHAPVAARRWRAPGCKSELERPAIAFRTKQLGARGKDFIAAYLIGSGLGAERIVERKQQGLVRRQQNTQRDIVIWRACEPAPGERTSRASSTESSKLKLVTLSRPSAQCCAGLCRAMLRTRIRAGAPRVLQCRRS